MASEIEVLRGWLSRADFKAIVDYAGGHKRTLSFLTALTYDQESLISWRAVEALGLAASKISEKDIAYVRNHLRRLFWLLTDESGGIGWRAPEAIAEIIRQQPDYFREFIPILVNLMDTVPEDALRFRASWLWAMGRLAGVLQDKTQNVLPWIYPCLGDPDSQVRGMAVWCLRQLNHPFPPGQRMSLESDMGEVVLYIDHQTERTQIRELLGSYPPG